MKGCVVIVQEIPWPVAQGERFAELLRGPRRRGMVGDRDVHDAPAFMREETSTNNSRHVVVGTTKKSAAASCWR